MEPYDESQAIAFQGDVRAAYAKAGAPYAITDDAHVVWVARMQYDAVTLGYPASRAKHLRELYVQLGLQPPFEPAPRVWRTNMCGIRVPGLPAVAGGASDPTLFLSWFYDRYGPDDRATLRAAAHAHGWTHWLLSWPDSRAVGASPQQFADTVQELVAAGFFPCPMLCSKDYDPSDFAGLMANIQPVLALLIGVAPALCIGWELNAFLSPTVVQQLTDTIAPQVTPAGTRCYVHFLAGYFAWQQPGQDTAAYWQANVGKLTGVLHQRDQNEDQGSQPEYVARITDCLVRFAGGYNFPTDSGFGHPFDFVALEITASQQFNGQMDEATGDSWGRAALATPASGSVVVMGSGNGQ